MKKSMFVIALVLTVGALVFIVEAASRQPAPRADGKLTIEQLIDIRHPSNPVWSPDGRHVAFLSERAELPTSLSPMSPPRLPRSPGHTHSPAIPTARAPDFSGAPTACTFTSRGAATCGRRR
jgi:Periplasmic component of the Tol biopolymer transport system